MAEKLRPQHRPSWAVFVPAPLFGGDVSASSLTLHRRYPSSKGAHAEAEALKARGVNAVVQRQVRGGDR